MRHPLLLLSGCLAALSVAACDRTPDTAAATSPAPADPMVQTSTDAAAGDSVSMRFACDGNHQVSVMGETVRVTMPDGTEVDLSRAPDQQPPIFTGEAMEFAVTEDGAVLGQDEGGSFQCREAE